MSKPRKKRQTKKSENQGDSMGTNARGIVSRYWKPATFGTAATTGGVLLEDYARSHGGSLAAYIKDGIVEGAKTLGPAIGNVLDEIGKSTINYVVQNPSQAALGLLVGTGTVLVGLKEGYIKNPFARN